MNCYHSITCNRYITILSKHFWRHRPTWTRCNVHVCWAYARTVISP